VLFWKQYIDTLNKYSMHSFLKYNKWWQDNIYFFFLIYMGCPGQLARTTTIPHSPLNILQAQGQVRHRGGDRRAHRGSNPGRGRNKSHDWPQQLGPQVRWQNNIIGSGGGEVMIQEKSYIKNKLLVYMLSRYEYRDFFFQLSINYKIYILRKLLEKQ